MCEARTRGWYPVRTSRTYGDREIARRAGVSDKTVCAIRQSVTAEIPQPERTYITGHGTESTMSVANNRTLTTGEEEAPNPEQR